MKNFTAFRETAEKIVKEHLNAYYFTEERAIDFDYSVWFFADFMQVLEMRQQEKWAFGEEVAARFKVCQFNKNEASFEGFTHFFKNDLHKDFYANFFELHNIDEEEFETLSISEKMEIVKRVDSESMQDFNNRAREEKIEEIIDKMNWTEIEAWYHANN